MSELSSIFYELVDGLMELQGADFGDLQLLNKTTARLEIVAHRNLGFEFLDHLRGVAADENSAYAAALKNGTRIIVEDVDTDPSFAAHRGLAASTGFRALQSTPLFERGSGGPVGVISTRFREPHRFCERELRLTDFYAMQAADVIAWKLTEQRLHDSEEALRRSEARLQAAADLLGLGLYAWDPHTNAVEWDGRVKAIWGLPADARVDYETWRRGVHPEDWPRVEEMMAKCIDPSDGIHEVEYRVLGLDGVTRWVAARGQTRFENGRPVEILGVALDITARKRAERSIRETEERFQQFAEHSSNVLWIQNVQTRRLDYLSPAFEAVWGQARNLEAGYWFETIHADDRDGAAAALEAASRGEVISHEYRIMRPGGSVRWMRDTMFPIRDQQGRMLRVGGIAQDVASHTGSLVYLIESDEGAIQHLQVLFQTAGYRLKTFASEAEFLQIAPVLLPGCVVLHLRSSNTAGLALPRQLHAYGAKLPVVIAGVSKGDVRLAVRAMKAGAADWLEMPYEEGALLETVTSALAAIQHAATRTREADLAHVKIAGMSLRERQVLEGLMAGGTNKVIAKQLGISPRTVELHRASVMERLGVSTLPEAVLMATAAGVRPAQPPKKSR
jgi:PAS domain S-box-containing protein